MKEMLGDVGQEVAANREVHKRMIAYLTGTDNNHHHPADLLTALRHRLDQHDTHHDGTVASEHLVKVLSQVVQAAGVSEREVDRWVRGTVGKGSKRVQIEEVMGKLENAQVR